MQIRRLVSCLAGVALAALMAVPTVSAQPPGGGPGGFGAGRGLGGGGLLALAQNEAVQKEVEMVEDQVQKVNQLAQQVRTEAQQAREGQQERPDFRNMSEAQRQQAITEMRERQQKQETATNAKLADILLPPQMDRLREIQIQQLGVAALQQEEVAAKLNLTAQQKERIATAQRENMESMRTRMQDLFQGGGGDREQMRERMTQLRTEADNKVLAVLTSAQKQQFEQLKGEPFEMPRQAFGGPGGQGRGPGAQGAPGGGQRGPGAGGRQGRQGGQGAQGGRQGGRRGGN